MSQETLLLSIFIIDDVIYQFDNEDFFREKNRRHAV